MTDDIQDLLRGVELVDGHHHLWQIGRFPYRWLDPAAPPARFGDKRSIARDYLLADHLAAFRGLPLTASVHVQANCGATDPAEETRWLQSLSEREGWPLAIVGEVDLTAPDAVEVIDRHRAFPALRALRTPVAWDKAGRWRVAAEARVLTNARFRSVARYLSKHGLCLEMVVVPEQLKDLGEFAKSQPDLAIAINHLATLEPEVPGNAAAWRDGIAALAKTPNVHVKVSGLWTVDRRWDPAILKPFVDHLLECLGSARMLYGSNAPVEAVNCPVPHQFSALAAVLGHRSRQELQDIFGETARKLYRLDGILGR